MALDRSCQERSQRRNPLAAVTLTYLRISLGRSTAARSKRIGRPVIVAQSNRSRMVL